MYQNLFIILFYTFYMTLPVPYQGSYLSLYRNQPPLPYQSPLIGYPASSPYHGYPPYHGQVSLPTPALYPASLPYIPPSFPPYPATTTMPFFPPSSGHNPFLALPPPQQSPHYATSMYYQSYTMDQVRPST